MHRNDIPDILFRMMCNVEPYPDAVAPVTEMVDTTAFFPGGKGLWTETETDVFPSILVLGQDFSNVRIYEEMQKGNTEDLNCPTWKNIIKLFSQTRMNISDCYFSNVFMGLRKTESMTGRFPGFKNNEFVQRNIDFLAVQIDLLKPKMIITLGIHAAIMLGKLSQNDLQEWKLAERFQDISTSIKQNVVFGSHKCTCVSLVHPCMRHVNVRKRSYMQFVGNDAEIQMLNDACRDCE